MPDDRNTQLYDEVEAVKTWPEKLAVLVRDAGGKATLIKAGPNWDIPVGVGISNGQGMMIVDTEEKCKAFLKRYIEELRTA